LRPDQGLFCVETAQYRVRLGADHPWLQADLHAAATDFKAVLVIAEHDQYRVADGLPGQAGARSAKGHRHLMRACQFKQLNHFLLRFDTHHQLGNQPLEAGVSAEGQGRQWIVETTLTRDQALDGG
jgi:hypothetical protein